MLTPLKRASSSTSSHHETPSHIGSVGSLRRSNPFSLICETPPKRQKMDSISGGKVKTALKFRSITPKKDRGSSAGGGGGGGGGQSKRLKHLLYKIFL